jgi:hypothetical protein
VEKAWTSQGSFASFSECNSCSLFLATLVFTTRR